MKHLTSQKYYAMLLRAHQLLEANCETINQMNVFPVPDGDTGSNMTRTLQGIVQVPFTPELPLGECAAKAGEAMLRSARGNSGVILSVFFRGVGRSLKGKHQATAADLAAAFSAGVESAYGAVMNPTEGTILTVMRAAAGCAQQVAELDPESRPGASLCSRDDGGGRGPAKDSGAAAQAQGGRGRGRPAAMASWASSPP